MQTKWYCMLRNKEAGPFNRKQMIEMVRSGRIKPTTLVRKNDSQWVAAKTVTGLFEKAGVFSGEHRCPYCGTPVDPPPTRCGTCKRRIRKDGLLGFLFSLHKRQD